MPSLLRRLFEWVHADRIPSSTLNGSENVTQICHDAAVCPSPPCQIFSNCVFRQALMTHQECFSCCLLFQNVIAFLCWNESEPSINQSNNSHFCDTQTRACGIFFRAFCARQKRIERQEKKLSERHWAESNTYKQGECSENSVCLVQLLAGLASILGFYVLSCTGRLSSSMI